MHDPNDSPTRGVIDKPVGSLAHLAWSALKAVSSLRITVVLLVFGIILVFYGTLAQIDEGIWTVMDKYFRSLYVWVPNQLNAQFLMKFFELPESTQWKGSFPIPGGWLIGWLMLVNLVAAHIVRFKLSWKRSGILIIHFGVIVLMFGEFFTGLYAVESTMVLQNNETVGFIDDTRRFELAISSRKDEHSNQVFVIPGSILLSESGKTISRDELPVDVEVIECTKNSEVVPRAEGLGEDGLIQFDGQYFKIVPTGEESGVKSEREDAAAAKIRVHKKGSGEVLGQFYLSLWQYRNYNRRLFFVQPQTFTLDGKQFTIELRCKRIEKPYTLHLEKFEHSSYAGTTIAKNFSSTVLLSDPENNEKRLVRIWMNNPLRFEGETFYQAGYIPDESGTILQVVYNPVWTWPYYSCAIVTIGMLIHFGINLNIFLRRRASS